MELSVLKIYSDYPCDIYIDGELNASIQAELYHKIPLRKGIYDIRIVPKNHQEFSYSREYYMQEFGIEDLLKVEFKGDIKRKDEELDTISNRVSERNKIVDKRTDEVIFESQEMLILDFNKDGVAPFVLLKGLRKRNYERYDYRSHSWPYGKVGFINYEGEIIIPAIYTEVYRNWKNFNKILIVKNSEGFWGAIDYDNNTIIPFELTIKDHRLVEVQEFILCGMNRGNKCGAYDTDGNIVIPFIYTDYICDGAEYYFNIGGEISPIRARVEFWEEDYIEAFSICGGKTNAYDEHGSIIQEIPYSDIIYEIGNWDRLKVSDPEHQFHYYYYNHRENRIYYFVESFDSDEIIGVENFEDYCQINCFSCGLARVAKKQGDLMLYGYINKNSELVIPCLYNEAEDFQNDYASVEIEGWKKLINNKGEVQTLPNPIRPIPGYGLDPMHFYGTTLRFYNKGCVCYWAQDDNGSFYDLVLPDGKSVLKDRYDDIERCGDFLCVEKSKTSLRGLIDYDGNIVIPCKYSRIVDDLRDVFHVKDNGRWGIYRSSINKEIVPCIYDKIEFDHWQDSFHVWIKSKVGLYNYNGNLLLECIYDEIKEQSPEMLCISINGRLGLYNGSIKKLIAEPLYDEVKGPFTIRKDLALFFMKTLDKWMCITSDGNQIQISIDAVIEDFKDGYNGPLCSINNIWRQCYYDYKGQTIRLSGY